MDLEFKRKTCFRTPDSVFQFEVMPLGLKNAPSTFTRMMGSVLRDLKLKTLILYLERRSDLQGLVRRTASSFERSPVAFPQGKSESRAAKCCFAAEQLKFLGYLVSAESILPNPENVSSIANCERPTTLKGVRSFLGAASFYRKFCEGFNRLAAPLLLHKNEQPFV